jgi:hypothetical protein
MTRKLFVNIPEYWGYGMKPQNFEDLTARISRPGGFWQVKQFDKLTGEVQVEQWLCNNFSDNGAAAMLKAIINASAPTVFTPANIIAVDQSVGFTTLATAIASGGTVTSITVNSLTGPVIPNGTKILVGAGGPTTILLTLTQTITGAGTFTVSSVTGPGSSIPIGSSVRFDYSAVSTADLSSLSAPVSYTAAMPAGQFTFASRQVTVTNSGIYVFSTTGLPVAVAANYTAAWLTNTNPVGATNQTVVHCVFDTPAVVNSTSNTQVTIVEKL